MQHPVRGRFAPTPSGRMHLGNLFTALLAWLPVRRAGGQMVLRIEDLDPLRTSIDFTRLLLDDLRWLGLDWDEGPDVGGPHAPYTQSERGFLYKACLDRLDAAGLLYPCFCSRAELHAADAPHLSDGSYIYNRRCAALDAGQRAERQACRPGATRVRVPDREICFQDGLRGMVCENLERECGDFILRRSDGVFAYQLCATADDGAMGITQVVRGRDLLGSTARQIWLLETLDYPAPAYTHTPLLLALDGRRLSKRDRDVDLGVLRDAFPQPEQLVGLLAWLAGQLPKPEPLTARELASVYDPTRLPQEDIIVDTGLWLRA